MSVIAISPARETAVVDGAPLLRWMIFTGVSAFALVLHRSLRASQRSFKPCARW
jgi:hypothetical protein